MTDSWSVAVAGLEGMVLSKQDQLETGLGWWVSSRAPKPADWVLIAAGMKRESLTGEAIWP